MVYASRIRGAKSAPYQNSPGSIRRMRLRREPMRGRGGVVNGQRKMRTALSIGQCAGGYVPNGGRVIRHLRGMTQAQLFGSDQSAKLVDWCESNLPFATFTINRLEPPLDFPDDKFDFVYALSVFTHLPAALQDAWMAELHRVLIPGGHLLLSTHGRYQLSALSEEEKKNFDAGQVIVKRPGSAGSNFCSYLPSRIVRAGSFG